MVLKISKDLLTLIHQITLYKHMLKCTWKRIRGFCVLLLSAQKSKPAIDIHLFKPDPIYNLIVTKLLTLSQNMLQF